MCAQAAQWSAEKVLDRLSVLEARFTPVTPWWGGGPNGCTTEFPSSSSIVGRVRWFLRTAYNTFCAKERELDNYEASRKFVDELLGSTGSASAYSFQIQIEALGSSPKFVDKSLSRVSQVPRVKLAMLGRKNQQCDSSGLGWAELKTRLPVEGNPFRLIVRRRDAVPRPRDDDVISGAVLITLAYLGVGKAASRGLGRFYPEPDAHVPQGAEGVMKGVLSGDPKAAFSAFYGAFRAACGGGDGPNDWRRSAVPLAPLAEDIVVLRHQGEVIDTLIRLGNCFMKSAW
ncbi:MAG: type III-B CRISPR module RAMP protein Cmr1, partial [Conexivisphaera sp.]